MKKPYVAIFCMVLLCIVLLTWVFKLPGVIKASLNEDNGDIIDIPRCPGLQIKTVSEGRDSLYYNGERIHQASAYDELVVIDHVIYFSKSYSTAYQYYDSDLMSLELSTGKETKLMKSAYLCGSDDGETLILFVGDCVPKFPDDNPMRLIYKYSDKFYQTERYVRYDPKDGSMESLESNPLEEE